MFQLDLDSLIPICDVKMDLFKMTVGTMRMTHVRSREYHASTNPTNLLIASSYQYMTVATSYAVSRH